jgi:hypothetical protein
MEIQELIKCASARRKQQGNFFAEKHYQKTELRIKSSGAFLNSR